MEQEQLFTFRINATLSVQRNPRIACQDPARHEPLTAESMCPYQDAVIEQLASLTRDLQSQDVIRPDIDPELSAWVVAVHPTGIGLLRRSVAAPQYRSTNR